MFAEKLEIEARGSVKWLCLEEACMSCSGMKVIIDVDDDDELL